MRSSVRTSSCLFPPVILQGFIRPAASTLGVINTVPTLPTSITARSTSAIHSIPSTRNVHHLHHNPRPQIHRPPRIHQQRPMPILSNLFSSSSSKSSSAPTDSSAMSFPGDKSENEWRAVLNKEQFRILREKGTEAPFAGQYDKHYPSEGVYACAACATPLYRANQKFKSGCGWPAFFDTIPGAVVRHEDKTLGMSRVEIMCANCGGHLGHVFKGEGYNNPTDERHCVNSVSLKFDESAKQNGA